MICLVIEYSEQEPVHRVVYFLYFNKIMRHVMYYGASGLCKELGID